jgi:hypothetical protein
MHGPDGTDYQEWITWREIVPPERIALLHGESRDVSRQAVGPGRMPLASLRPSSIAAATPPG